MIKRKQLIRFTCINILIYFITFKVLLPIICSSWPYSHYFSWSSEKQLRKKAILQNEQRSKEAANIISSLDSSLNVKHYASLLNKSCELTIILITTPRSDEMGRSLKYVYQSVVSVHHQLQQQTTFNCISLQLCDVNIEQNTDLTELKKYFPIKHGYGDKQDSGIRDREALKDSPRKFKETKDYGYCLQAALKTGAEYVLVLEDDAVLRQNSLQTLEYIIKTKLKVIYEHRTDSDVDKRDWLYINLFHPRNWQGFSKSGSDYRGLYLTVVEIVSYSYVGASLVLLAVWVVYRSSLNMYYWLVLLSGCVYVVVLVYMVGRPHLLELYGVSKHLHKVFSPAYGCCTPAILFQSRLAGGFVSYLNSDAVVESSDPIDLVLDRYAKTNMLDTFGVEPNLVTHIGMVSSVKLFRAIYARDFVDLQF